MKTVSILKNMFFLTLAIFTFAGCKKENTSALQSQSSASQQTNLEFQNLQLVLQPGLENGDDADVQILDSDPNSGNANSGQIPELDIITWTINGSPFYVRSYIKFDSLLVIPKTAKIGSARLHLYGVKNSIYTPQGNSIYPGSVYNQFPNNSCIISRVKSDWSENSITWNNAPDWHKMIQDTIPISTSQWNYDVVIDVTNLVKNMVQDSSNYGFSIRLSKEFKYRSMIFASSDNSDARKRPKLVVNYKLQ